MNTLDGLIDSRYSERNFSCEQVPENIVDELCEVALKVATPSGSSPLKLYLLQSEEIRDLLAAELIKGRDHLLALALGKDNEKKLKNTINYYYRYSEKLLSAPIIIALATKAESGFSKRLSRFGLDSINDISISGLDITVGLSLQNIQLKCTELGLGSCIMTAPLSLLDERVAKFADEDYEVRSFIAIGIPEKKKENGKPVLRGSWRKL